MKNMTDKSIEEWLIQRISELMEIPRNEIDPAAPFMQYGLDSSSVIALTGDLADWLEREVDPTFAYDYPTIRSLAQYLAAQT